MTPTPKNPDAEKLALADELELCAKSCEVYSPDQCATLIDGIGWLAMRHKLRRAAHLLRALEQPAQEGLAVVGHKTFDDGRGGFRHEPLTRAEADVLIAHCKSEDERRKALMPDERSAIRMMMDAHTRLTDMGWKDPVYCPKDGSTFEVIEPGSTGIHKCIYMGEWPNGSWWALDAGDMYPSRPVLFRTLPAAPTKENRNG